MRYASTFDTARCLIKHALGKVDPGDTGNKTPIVQWQVDTGPHAHLLHQSHHFILRDCRLGDNRMRPYLITSQSYLQMDYLH
jgi:hypothetical protein